MPASAPWPGMPRTRSPASRAMRTACIPGSPWAAPSISRMRAKNCPLMPLRTAHSDSAIRASRGIAIMRSSSSRPRTDPATTARRDSWLGCPAGACSATSRRSIPSMADVKTIDLRSFRSPDPLASRVAIARAARPRHSGESTRSRPASTAGP